MPIGALHTIKELLAETTATVDSNTKKRLNAVTQNLYLQMVPDIKGSPSENVM
jgi:hypothetical protein